MEKLVIVIFTIVILVQFYSYDYQSGTYIKKIIHLEKELMALHVKKNLNLLWHSVVNVDEDPSERCDYIRHKFPHVKRVGLDCYVKGTNILRSGPIDIQMRPINKGKLMNSILYVSNSTNPTPYPIYVQLVSLVDIILVQPIGIHDANYTILAGSVFIHNGNYFILEKDTTGASIC